MSAETVTISSLGAKGDGVAHGQMLGDHIRGRKGQRGKNGKGDALQRAGGGAHRPVVRSIWSG